MSRITMVPEEELHGLSARDLILKHVRANRHREITTQEISEIYGLKASTISNAIKQLSLEDYIEIERRPLTRGRYTVIWNKGSNITERASHPKEKKREDPKEEELRLPELSGDFLGELLKMLLQLEYNHAFVYQTIKDKNMSPFDLSQMIFTPLMHRVGQLWEDEQISTAEEHLVTQRVRRLIFDTMANTQKEARGTILLVPVAGEEHTVSLEMIENLLRPYYKVINMAQTLPVADLTEYVREHEDEIDWVFLSITRATLKGTLTRQVTELSQFENLKIAVGGQGVDEIDPDALMNIHNVIKDGNDWRAFYLSLIE